MKNILLFLVIFYFCNPTHAQQYWSKTYDPFEHEADQIMNIRIEEDVIYASCRGTCLKDTVNECFKIVKFDLEGNLLEGYEDKVGSALKRIMTGCTSMEGDFYRDYI